jgi:hypothetical protein
MARLPPIHQTIAEKLAEALPRHDALRADVVFAAWPDLNQPGGIGFWPVKGEAKLNKRAFTMDGVTVVRVSDREEALALRDKLGGNGGA